MLIAVLLAANRQHLGPGAVKLSDSGIAVLMEAAGSGHQLFWSKILGRADDSGAAPRVYANYIVYAVAVVLYELLSGRTPFKGQGIDYPIGQRHVASDVPRLPCLALFRSSLTKCWGRC